MIEVKVTFEGDAREAWLKRRKHLQSTIQRAAVAAARGMSAYTHSRYLNFDAKGPPQPNGLRHQTGRLGRAANATAAGRPQDRGGFRVKTEWGVLDPKVDYAFKHEYGGDFVERIPAHTRRMRSRDVKSGRRIIAQGFTFVNESRTFTRTYKPRRMFANAKAEVGERIVRQAGETAIMLLNSSGNAPNGESIRAALVSAGAPMRDPR